jgi:TIR domain
MVFCGPTQKERLGVTMKIRVFISYAKINNLPPIGTKEGWVDRFEMELKNRLAEEVGRLDRFELWRDNARLNNFEEIGGQIGDALKGTDIFLMVASHAYLESRWCSEIELPTFIARNFGRRIFCVKTRPVEPDALPEQLREVLGFDFWEEEPGGYRTLGDPVTTAHEDAKFHEMIRRLARQLGAVICELRDKQSQVAEDKPQVAEDKPPVTIGPSVFLADASDDLEEVREGVEQYLRQFRVRVLSSAEFPTDAAGHQAALTSSLQAGVTFVQLLSRVPGRKLNSERLTQLQYRVARELGRRVLQWRDPNLLQLDGIADPAHRALLETAAAIGIEEFKLSVLQAARLEAEPAPMPEQDLSQAVFINCAAEDRAIAEPLVEAVHKSAALWAAKGVNCIFAVDAGQPSAIRSDLELKLQQCGAMILVYGGAPVDWVKEQVRQIRKTVMKRKRAFKAIALYDGPPDKKVSLDFSALGIELLDCREGFELNKMNWFLASLVEGL